MLAAIALLTGCAAKSGDVGALDDAGASDSMSGSSAGETGEEETTTGTGGDGGPSWCVDLDGDGFADGEDNEPNHHNPYQSDIDEDGIANVIDLCPLTPSANNTGDSDQDGVGNDCDTCRQTIGEYNEGANEAGVPAYMQVRNIPSQGDADEDGIGDACDNCVWTPNCEDYGSGEAYEIGDPIAYDDPDVCQTDANADKLGDACEGMVMRPNAAGPVGFGDADDFDQDGITNQLDTCPRQPLTDVDVVACTDASECADGRTCDDGWCNHLDTDQDRVGDICDTCSSAANPMQVLDGGAQEDDADGDFVGSVCETSPACAAYSDPRRFNFFAVNVGGSCCTVRLAESPDAFDDPSGVQIAVGDLLDVMSCEEHELSALNCPPIRARHPEDPLATLPVRTAEHCPQEQVDGAWVCRQLPPAVAAMPGILVPPAGCDAALASVGMTLLENSTLRPGEGIVEGGPGNLDGLWQHLCFLPQFDEDFDGLGDTCDLCPFSFDPDNTQYVDDDGMLWPADGQLCSGEFACE